jgi:hypothetical protein
VIGNPVRSLGLIFGVDEPAEFPGKTVKDWFIGFPDAIVDAAAGRDGSSFDLLAASAP